MGLPCSATCVTLVIDTLNIIDSYWSYWSYCHIAWAWCVNVMRKCDANVMALVMQVCLDYIPNPEEASGRCHVSPLGATGRAPSVGHQLWGATPTTNASWNGTTGTLGSTSLSRGSESCEGLDSEQNLPWLLRSIESIYPSFSTIIAYGFCILYIFVFTEISDYFWLLSNSIRLLVSWCRHCAHFGSRGAWRSGAFTKRSVPASRQVASLRRVPCRVS